MSLSPADIIDFLEKRAKAPLSDRDILEPFDLNRPERQKALRLLDEMVKEGTLVQLKGKRYSLPSQVNLVIGRVSVHRDGYGFVAPSGEGADVFVPARYLREVMNGDRVAVRIERGWRGQRREGRGGREGRVVRVLERAHQTLVGRFEMGRGFGYVVPADPRLHHDIFIPGDATGGARPGQVVVARIEAYPGRNRNPEGVVVEVLGDPDDPKVEILAIVHKYGLPHNFPSAVQESLGSVPNQVLDGDWQGRKDLTSIPFVTIDGETAKDFDDAVAVQSEAGGGIRLWVAIADVGHYVAEGSAIDREAHERATSVYFPGQCIPMLPEVLSNGICSLNPGVERLAMVAEMVFDTRGHRTEELFYPAVILSRARLTYTEVWDGLEGRGFSGGGEGEALLAQLHLMAILAERLTAMRRARGSLDFDLPEAEIILDLRGKAENIVRAERNSAHRLIEEFMLAANEAVAGFLTEREAPFLYRIHEPPELEKLQAFQQFIAYFNLGLKLGHQGVEPLELQKLLAEVEGRPEERMINQVLLRSMKQARYSPDNVGHFGLAADPYCHFTSPIRRYPDLVVHRVLREVLVAGKLSQRRISQQQKYLPEAGEHSSQMERRAMEAEREIVDLKKCQFMADKVDEEFEGYVSSVQPFGFFVELSDFFVEGLVHISSLSDDFYQYEEELHRLIGQSRRRQFQIGSQVRVRVKNVNLDRREIDFALADLEPPARKKQGPSKRRKRVAK